MYIRRGAFGGGGGAQGSIRPPCYILAPPPLGKLDHLEDFTSSLPFNLNLAPLEEISEYSTAYVCPESST